MPVAEPGVKHTHLIPTVLRAVTRVAQEFHVRWIRRPFDFRWPGEPPTSWRLRLGSRLLGSMRPIFDRLLAQSGCRSTDHFIGLRMTGRFDAADLVRLIPALPPGITEFMCHPGRCGPELESARTRLKPSRERELAALIAPETREALTTFQVELVGFRDFCGDPR